MNSSTINVMIADDHRLVIDGIKLMFSTEEDIACVGEASNGQELLDLLKVQPADVVLLDIDMPILNGLDTCKKLQKLYPDLRIIILSMLKEASLIKTLLKYGIKGFLLKNSGKEEIVDAIREVHDGKSSLNDEVSSILIQSLSNQKQKKNSRSNPFPQLSRREKQVLQLIVDEHITSEIAEKLFISPDTVESHRRRLLSKIGVRNTAGLVRACMEYGLLDEAS